MFKKTKLSVGVLLALGSLASLTAQAQQQLERVEVTGSAIKRIDAETSVPVTVIQAVDLKKQGITSVEQVMSALSAVQMQTGTSQAVGAGTGGASFADLRGIGANKTLVLLNGRRIANNALDSSAPDLNTIPFAAIDRIEVLRDGASSLYGTDAIGGVINFITKKDFTGGSITVGLDKPQHPGGRTHNINAGFGFGDLDKDGFNLWGFVDAQKQDHIGGTDRAFNVRKPGGLSPTTFPANYFQAGASYNPSAPGCTSNTNITPAKGGTGCQESTSSFVDYVPKSERTSAMARGTLKLNADTFLAIEAFATRSKVDNVIAPVPYGALLMNPLRADGTANPYYPGNSGSGFTVPAGLLDPTYITATAATKGAKPGFVNIKWRDLYNGSRETIDVNNQQRLVASLDGVAAGWDYQVATSYNSNKLDDQLKGYSNGTAIRAGMLNGVLNPFGDQDAAGKALLDGAALAGTLQTAKGTVTTVDARASRELGDWLSAGRAAAIAIGAEFRHEKFTNSGNVDFATKVIASTGFDPNTLNEGSRNVSAFYSELNVPIIKTLDVTAAFRYDKYSDSGSTVNPKFGFRFQPNKEVLLRGSYSTGFRAPSLYELNAAQTYTNTSQFDDPVNCPGGVPVKGKSSAANCQQQFQTLNGGNPGLKPEKAKNYTLGLVFEPVKDLSITADLWWVKLRQSIGAIADTTVFGDPVKYAALFHRNPAGDLSTDGSLCPDPTTCGYIDTRTQNLGGVKTNGVDLSAIYSLKTGVAGDFRFSLASTRVMNYSYQNEDGGEYIQNVSVYSGAGPIFKWQHNANVTWSYSDFSLGVLMHYKTGYLDQTDTNTVSSYHTVDLYGTWSPIKTVTLTLGVKNLGDVEPPYSNQTAKFQANYDPRYSDPTGRTYYARANYKF